MTELIVRVSPQRGAEFSVYSGNLVAESNARTGESRMNAAPVAVDDDMEGETNG